MSDTVIGSTGERGENVATGRGIQQQRVDVQAVRDSADLVAHRLNEMQMDIKSIAREINDLRELRRDLTTVRNQTEKLANMEAEFERRLIAFEREYDRRLEQQRQEYDRRITGLWQDFNTRLQFVYIRFGVAFVVLALGEIGLIFWLRWG